MLFFNWPTTSRIFLGLNLPPPWRVVVVVVVVSADVVLVSSCLGLHVICENNGIGTGTPFCDSVVGIHVDAPLCIAIILATDGPLHVGASHWENWKLVGLVVHVRMKDKAPPGIGVWQAVDKGALIVSTSEMLVRQVASVNNWILAPSTEGSKREEEKGKGEEDRRSFNNRDDPGIILRIGEWEGELGEELG